MAKRYSLLESEGVLKTLQNIDKGINSFDGLMKVENIKRGALSEKLGILADAKIIDVTALQEDKRIKRYTLNFDGFYDNVFTTLCFILKANPKRNFASLSGIDGHYFEHGNKISTKKTKVEASMEKFLKVKKEILNFSEVYSKMKKDNGLFDKFKVWVLWLLRGRFHLTNMKDFFVFLMFYLLQDETSKTYAPLFRSYVNQLLHEKK